MRTTVAINWLRTKQRASKEKERERTISITLYSIHPFANIQTFTCDFASEPPIFNCNLYSYQTTSW